VDRWTATFAGLTRPRSPATTDRPRPAAWRADELRFGETELREETWNPMLWVYLVGGGLHPLLAREFAPLHERLASVAGRLEGIPGLLVDARAAIGSVPERPVSKLHAEVAGRRIGGVADLGRQAVATAGAAAPDDPEVAAGLPRVRAAADAAAAALDAFGRWLADEVAPAAPGGPTLGEHLFARSCGTRCATPTSRRRGSSSGRRPSCRGAGRDGPHRPRGVAGLVRRRASTGRRGALVRGVLEAIAAEHPKADELVSWCQGELGRIEAFCREQAVIALVDEPLEIDWTPEFMRSFGGAMLDSPGPLDLGQKTFFSITPCPRTGRPTSSSPTCAR
jgi:hypothetical protein